MNPAANGLPNKELPRNLPKWMLCRMPQLKHCICNSKDANRLSQMNLEYHEANFMIINFSETVECQVPLCFRAKKDIFSKEIEGSILVLLIT